MPLSGLLFLVAWWAVLGFIWTFFSFEAQPDNEAKEKLKTYFLYSLWWNIMALQKEGLSAAFKHVPQNFQWSFAFLIPILRNGNKLNDYHSHRRTTLEPFENNANSKKCKRNKGKTSKQAEEVNYNGEPKTATTDDIYHLL